MKNKISEKTRFLVIRDPDYLAGKIFNEDEITELISIIKGHPNLYLIFDRRVDFLVDRKTDRLATDPEIFQKSIYLYSAGKMFNTEDWCIGWTIGGKALLQYLPVYAQWIRFNPNTPAMVAYGKFFDRCGSETVSNITRDQRPKLQTLYERYSHEITAIDPDLKLVDTELRYFPLIDVEGILNKLPKSELENTLDVSGNKHLLDAAVEYLNNRVGEPRFQALSDESQGNYLVVYKAFS